MKLRVQSMQILTVLLAIAAILTCPYGCLGGAGCCGTETLVQRSCCDYCCHETTPEHHQTPPTEDDSGTSCLCDGAVLGQGTIELDQTGEDQLSPSALVLAFGDPHFSIAATRFEIEGVRPHGDGLRIAIRSFLC